MRGGRVIVSVDVIAFDKLVHEMTDCRVTHGKDFLFKK